MRELTYATVCSGVECIGAAVIDLPMRPVFFSEIEPFPCAVLKHHYPHVPNLGDMSKIRVTESGKEITNGRTTVALPAGGLDVFIGGTPCFAAGTMVLTPSGYRPIEEIRVGDMVVAGSGALRRVTAAGSKMAKVGRLKVLGRPDVTCTPNHPFMCVEMKRDNRRKSPTYGSAIPTGDFAKTRADEVAGKYVGRVSRNFGGVDAPRFPKCGNATDADIMELAGWYLGDGYIRRFTGKSKKCVTFALCSPDKIRRFTERFGGIVHITDQGDKQTICCTALADWLSENFGERAHAKRVPYWCYGHPDAYTLIAGYRMTDGTTQGAITRFSTVSPALAYGIADILGNASVCIQRTPPTCTIQGRTVNQRDYFVVSWAHGKTPRTKFIGERYATKARGFTGTDGTVRVYNITVEDEHTYIANGLLSHNCQDVSAAGLRRGMAEGSGTRSSLAFEFVRLIGELRPRWIVWENVFGVLSDPSFPGFLTALAERGYGLAYRTLDAQYVRCADIHHPDGRVVRLERAVPQRRRRVWVVGRAGGDVGAASEVLLEFDRALGDKPPRRRPGKGTARTAAQGHGVAVGMVGATAIAGNVVGRGIGTGGNGVGAKDETAYTLDTVGGQSVAAHGGARGADGFDPYEPGGLKTLNGELAGTVINGTCPGCHGAVVERCETYENHAQDGRVIPCGGASPTMGASNLNGPSCGNPLVVEGRAVTNSNDGDVMPCIAAQEYKQFDSQKDRGGGYVLERRQTGADLYNASITDGVAATMGTMGSPVNGAGPALVESPPIGFKYRQGAGARSVGAEPEVSPCLSSEQHDASCALSFNAKMPSMDVGEEIAATMLATSHKEMQSVCVKVEGECRA